jgi:hypothetical protein
MLAQPEILTNRNATRQCRAPEVRIDPMPKIDAAFQPVTLTIGPSSAIGASSRGMSSGCHVGKIDHWLGIGDFPYEEGNDPEPAVSLLEGRRAIGENARDLVALDQDESAAMLA